MAGAGRAFFTRSAQPWLQPAPGAQCFETRPKRLGKPAAGVAERIARDAGYSLAR
jgi:hypothetical protein